MHLGSQAQAVMLLTVSFGKSDKSGAKPLSTKEWARFAVWLRDHDLDPSALLKGDVQTLLTGWMDRAITLSRLSSLLDRGGALGLALEKWQRAGLWIIIRSDPEYPERLKRRLRLESPPVMFGCGNKKLLGRGGIAVVGSRDADQDDIAFAENLGNSATKQGYSVVSGAARGVDESGMFGALKNEGTAIGVMADSLLRTATAAKFRKYILAGDLVLITPFNPEAGFNVGNAMSRNRYIYCLADAAVVVSSTPNKGGTWNGAIEDLKAAWVPLWVKPTTNAKSGNFELVQKGAHWFPDDLSSLACLLNGSSDRTAEDRSVDLPLFETEAPPSATTESAVEISEPLELNSGSPEVQQEKADAVEPVAETKPDLVDVDFYTLFLNQMLDITGNDPGKVEEIAVQLELEKSQVNTWLKRGVADGKIKKLTRPVRYQSTASVRQQASLFGDDG
ncbi:MAG: DNA-processing protein DprA [Aestuariivita sp.]|nr:DNA-processing protein DprA [Aestuariivita sp.]